MEALIAFITFIVILIMGLIGNVLAHVPMASIDTPTQTYTGGGALSREQTRIGREFRKYAEKDRPPFRKFCFPDAFRLQKQQGFLGEFMDPDSGTREILAFHEIGAGKTCAAIQVAGKYRRPIVVMPASLVSGFRAELRSPCSGVDEYRISADLTPGTREWKRAVAASNELIDKKYQIMSYNKFVDEWEGLRGDCIIVDEVHNLANPDGAYYNSVHGWVTKHPRASVLLMSATPIFDSPSELAGLARLLRCEGDITTPADCEREFAGKVSYYAGAPSYTFPEAIIKEVKLPMSAHQSRWYKSETASEISARGNVVTIDAANNFYAATRQRANVAYPRGLTGEDGLRALTVSDILGRLAVYSCKMAFLQKKLRKRQLTFIYSSYTGAGGIDLICKCLRAWGYRDYFKAGPGVARYAVFDGDTSDSHKDELREVFNSRGNDGGGLISVIVGSSAMNAGVSLFRVRAAHLIDLHWNDSRLKQIIGRTVRFCSHKTLPREDRNVRIYLYVAHTGGVAHTGVVTPDPEYSIDAYMLDIAKRKKMENEPFLQALRNVAVDRALYGGV